MKLHDKLYEVAIQRKNTTNREFTRQVFAEDQSEAFTKALKDWKWDSGEILVKPSESLIVTITAKCDKDKIL